jgi:proline iminopeptidase
MSELYPDTKPYVTHSLAVDSRHTLHVEECGTCAGLPAVYLHGGPGAGYQAFHRSLFDPQRFRIVLFDQRGCGRSTPHAELADNHTQALVADIEAIREHLQIERWVVCGGSWGSTLALVYAQTHPHRVLGLILRGVFLCRPRDLQWFYQDGASRIFPDYWEDFTKPIPQPEREDLLTAYHRRLTGPDELARMAAAKAWALWEGRAATLREQPTLIAQFTEPYAALALARIETHYFVNGCFLKGDEILRHADRLAGTPGIIVQGRYDAICPADGAWALHKRWPDAELRIVPEAGHAATEPGICSALVEASVEMGKRFS